MTEHMNVEDCLEVMTRRLGRVERVNRLMKVWGSIAIAGVIAAGPFASSVMATGKTKPVVASEFELESNGKIVAVLGTGTGQPDLQFFDSAGKPVLGVGIDPTALPTGHAAGISVFDGNADIPGTGKLRAGFGVTPSGPFAGVGALTFDGNGIERTSIGSAIDGSISELSLFDATGAFRTGVQYAPALNFNGFTSQDGNGHPLSLLGNVLAPVGILVANDSFMNLLDTSGTQRVLEFQNSTNEGGLDFNAGSTTVQGGWGNF